MSFFFYLHEGDMDFWMISFSCLDENWLKGHLHDFESKLNLKMVFCASWMIYQNLKVRSQNMYKRDTDVRVHC